MLGLCLAVFAHTLSAQAKPDYFPDDIDGNVSSAQIRCLCKPGVRNKSRSKGMELSYTWIGKGTYKPESNGLRPPFSSYNHWQNLKVSLKAPVLNKPGLKLLVGYRFVGEFFNFNNYGSDYQETFRALDQKLLKSHSLSLLFTKSFSEKHYLIVRFRNSVNGNYSGFKLYDQRYNIHKGLVMYGVKRDEDFEWGVGLNYSSGFRNRTSILPFVMYNRNFNEKWAIESALPAFVFLRRNQNPNCLFLTGFEYSGQSYRLDVPAGQNSLDYAFNHSEILLSLQMEHRITEWVWANIKVGYQLNFSSDLQARNDFSTDFSVEPTNAPFFRIGLFLSPPPHLNK